MKGRVYKSSIFNKVLYSLITASIILPGLWVMLYGLATRSYNWPMIIMGAFLCSYVIIILQKHFSYRIFIGEEHVEIRGLDGVKYIKYRDIVGIHIKRGGCYIIDLVGNEGQYFIRGTTPPIKYESCLRKVNINLRDLPVIQEAFVENYDDLVDNLLGNCSMSGKVEVQSCNRRRKSKSNFISLSLQRELDNERIGILDTLITLYPYFLLILVVLMSLIIFVLTRKTGVALSLITHVKFVFPLFAVVSIYILVARYVMIFKTLLIKKSVNGEPLQKGTLPYLIGNILISSVVMLLFFYMLSRFAV